MLAGKGDKLVVKVEVAQLRRGVGGKVDNQCGGFGHRMGDRPVERLHVAFRIEAAVMECLDVAQGAAGDHEAVGVDRVGWVRYEHDIARRGDRHGEVGKTLLGAERGDDFGVGVECHAEAARIIAGLRPSEPGDALGGGIAVGAGFADGLHQLVDDMGGGIHIRIAHAEIDDVLSLCPVLGLEPVDLCKDVRRQALDAVEFLGHGWVPGSCCSLRRGSRPFGRET